MKNDVKESRSRSWLVTVPASGKHAYSREAIIQALTFADAYLGQLEEGSETGYRHWQLLIEQDEPIRFGTLRKRLPHCHLEPRRGTIGKAVTYVTKSDTRIPGEPPLAKGTIKASEQGKRNDLEELRKRILQSDISLHELVLENPAAASHRRLCETLIEARDDARWGAKLREVEVHVLFGDTGTGKTKTLFEQGFRDVCRVTHYGPGAFDHYSGQNVLALDEYAGQYPIEFLLTLLDRYPLKLPARYFDRTAAFSTVFLLSNRPPWEWYPVAPIAQKAALARRVTEVTFFQAGSAPEILDPELVVERMTKEQAQTAVFHPPA